MEYIRVPACPCKGYQSLTQMHTMSDTRGHFLINLTQRDHLGPTKRSRLLLGVGLAVGNVQEQTDFGVKAHGLGALSKVTG